MFIQFFWLRCSCMVTANCLTYVITYNVKSWSYHRKRRWSSVFVCWQTGLEIWVGLLLIFTNDCFMQIFEWSSSQMRLNEVSSNVPDSKSSKNCVCKPHLISPLMWWWSYTYTNTQTCCALCGLWSVDKYLQLSRGECTRLTRYCIDTENTFLRTPSFCSHLSRHCLVCLFT